MSRIQASSSGRSTSSTSGRDVAARGAAARRVDDHRHRLVPDDRVGHLAPRRPGGVQLRGARRRSGCRSGTPSRCARAGATRRASSSRARRGCVMRASPKAARGSLQEVEAAERDALGRARSGSASPSRVTRPVARVDVHLAGAGVADHVARADAAGAAHPDAAPPGGDRSAVGPGTRRRPRPGRRRRPRGRRRVAPWAPNCGPRTSGSQRSVAAFGSPVTP